MYSKWPRIMSKHLIACGVALSRAQMYTNSFVHRCTQIVSLQQKPDDSFIIRYSGVFFDKHLAIVNSSQDSNI